MHHERVAFQKSPNDDYLSGLNAAQRRAVEHGCANLDNVPPLLIIAGAGSGKTNTLAHRVAHLMVSGADPRRMMLLTFSRRAAAEMQRRVERIAGKVLGQHAGAIRERGKQLDDSTPQIQKLAEETVMKPLLPTPGKRAAAKRGNPNGKKRVAKKRTKQTARKKR